MMMMLKAEKYNVNEPAADCTPSSSINLSEHIFRRLRSNRIDKLLQQNAAETALFPLEAVSYPEHRRCQCRHLQYVYIKRPQRPVYSPLKLTLTLPAATTELQGDENDKGRSALKGVEGAHGAGGGAAALVVKHQQGVVGGGGGVVVRRSQTLHMKKRRGGRVHLVDEVPDVSRVGHDRSDWVLGLGDDGTLVHPADARRLVDDVLQGVRLLQLAQDLTWSSSPPPSSSYFKMLSLTSSSGSISSCLMRMEMMAPVPRPAAATAPRVVQSPCSSQGHTFTLMTDRLDIGGFPESDTITGTSYTPGSRYIWYRRPRRP
ncbi:hypothetical protein F7725_000942 [Dissostichus mawsoni]|uniref:Uncharacterized protein n=1 Tax=Dissostichus mawsoni TaxID=36200 RepID=A0A7J5ZJ13_DISMA|nr:hypothetical protein F7725_000942 [Dissostichus mawsoni]